MAQNIYDTAAFFEGYSRLPRSRHGLDGAPEWPAIRALLPDLRDKRVVDLGCGFGWFARWARGQGAAHVVGVDLSANMIERAKRDTTDERVDYRIADLETLDLPAAAYEFAYSSLAFHYVEDFGRLVRMVHQALIPGGRFAFTIEHPIYMAPSKPGWSKADDGRMSWPVDGYSVEGRRVTDWLAKGVVKYHRTIATTLNTLITAGFVLRGVVEFAPTGDQIAGDARLAPEVERPMILIVSAER